MYEDEDDDFLIEQDEVELNAGFEDFDGLDPYDIEYDVP